MFTKLNITELPYSKSELIEFSNTKNSDFLNILFNEYNINSKYKLEIKISKLYNLYGNSKNVFEVNLDICDKINSKICQLYNIEYNKVLKKINNIEYLQKLKNLNPLFLKDKSDIYIYGLLYNIEIINNDFIYFSNLLYLLKNCPKLQNFINIDNLNKLEYSFILQTYFSDIIVQNYFFKIRNDIKRKALLYLNPTCFYIYLLTDTEIQFSLLSGKIVVDLNEYRIRYLRMLNLYNCDPKILKKFLNYYKYDNIYTFILNNEIYNLESRLIFNPVDSLETNINKISVDLGINIINYEYFLDNFLDYADVIYFDKNTDIQINKLHLYSDYSLIQSLDIYLYYNNRKELIIQIQKYLNCVENIFFLNLDYCNKKIYYGNFKNKIELESLNIKKNLVYNNSNFMLNGYILNGYDIEKLIQYLHLLYDKSEIYGILNYINFIKRT